MRLFIANPIQANIRSELDKIITNLKKTNADIKWVRPESIHITLKFLGEVEEQRVNDIFNVLLKYEGQKGVLQAEIKGVGFFPDLKHPRVIWIGLEEKPAYLAELASIIDSDLSKLGFEKEKRSFSPHLTIGRFRSLHRSNHLLEETENIRNTSFSTFQINEYNLYLSVLKPSGAEYKILRSFKL